MVFPATTDRVRGYLPATTGRSPGYWVESAPLDPGTHRVACQGCAGRTVLSGVTDEIEVARIAGEWFLGHQVMRHGQFLS